MDVQTLVALSVLVAVASSVDVANFQAYAEYEKDVFHIREILMRPRKPERFLPKSFFEKHGLYESSRLLGFNYKDCGSTGRETAKIVSLKLTPDPLKLPGNIGVSFSVLNSKEAYSPIHADVTLKKKIGIWIEVPCINNMGSCSYSDICKMLPQSQCPPAFKSHHIPCACPVKQGNFTLPTTEFMANVPSVPGGDYSAKVVLRSKSGPLACLEMEFSIA